MLRYLWHYVWPEKVEGSLNGESMYWYSNRIVIRTL